MANKLIQIEYNVNDAGLLRAAKSIKANETAAKGADDQVKKFGKSADAAGNQASKSFLNLGNVWKGLIGIGIVAMFTSLAKKAVDLGIKQEQLNIAFGTFLGSAEKARKLLEQLNKFALVTPFTPDQVNKAAQALLAFGVQGSKIIPTLKILGDVSAGTGKDLGEMAIIFGQIRSTGRLMGQDLLQLINAGFNPLQIISEKTGQSVKVLKQEMEKGNITFEMVEQSFIDATSAGGLFFDLMEKQSKTIGGVLSTIEGNFDEFLKNLFAAESGNAKRFVDMMEQLSRGLLLFSLTEDQVLAKGNEIIKDRFKTLVQSSGQALEDIDAAIDASIASLDALHRKALTSGSAEEANAILKDIEVKKQQKIAIQELVEARKEEAKVAETKKLQTRLENEATAAKELNKRLKELEGTLKGEGERTMEEEAANAALSSDDGGKSGFWQLTLRLLEKHGDDIISEMEIQADTELQLQHDTDLAEIDAEKRKQKQIKDLRQQAFDFGVSLIYQFFNARWNAEDEDFQREKGNFDKRLVMAGDNDRARMEIEVERQAFEAEQDALAEQHKIELARRDKERQIKQMILAGALNSILALRTPPVPNFIAAGLNAAFTVGQIAIAKGIGFKEGVIGLHGPGTGTSDSIPAMLSKGESVITADATSGSRILLEAINERRIDDRILKKSGSGGSVKVDNSDILEELRKRKEPRYYEEGYFVNQVIEKNNTLKLHTRAKYLSK